LAVQEEINHLEHLGGGSHLGILIAANNMNQPPFTISVVKLTTLHNQTKLKKSPYLPL